MLKKERIFFKVKQRRIPVDKQLSNETRFGFDCCACGCGNIPNGVCVFWNRFAPEQNVQAVLFFPAPTLSLPTDQHRPNGNNLGTTAAAQVPGGLAIFCFLFVFYFILVQGRYGTGTVRPSTHPSIHLNPWSYESAKRRG